MNNAFNAIINRHGRDVVRQVNGLVEVLKVIISPQKGENRRATKFLEPNEFWLFSVTDTLNPHPMEGTVFTRDAVNFLVVESQYDSNADTIKCGMYLLPFELDYYAPLNDGTFTSDGRQKSQAVEKIYGNKEEVGRVLDRWKGLNEDTEVFVIPPVANKPAKGSKFSWNGKTTEIDKVQPLYSSNGKFIGWRLKG
jgi:hypothetical protein